MKYWETGFNLIFGKIATKLFKTMWRIITTSSALAHWSIIINLVCVKGVQSCVPGISSNLCQFSLSFTSTSFVVNRLRSSAKGQWWWAANSTKAKKSVLAHLGDNLSHKKDEVDQEDTDDFVTRKNVFELIKIQESFSEIYLTLCWLMWTVGLMAWSKIWQSWNLAYSFLRKTLKTSTEQMTKIEKEIGKAQAQVESKSYIECGEDG